MRYAILTAALLAGVQAQAAEAVTMRDCQERLETIANAQMSADDTPVLQQCAINGYINATDIERAYERAKKAGQ
ncbi:hypothetical protein [Ensifer adhaerens]|uniref:hypothetical protein n=1 Tax=Ensifer adhaerens TaxID=106592 RepID=UPI00098FD867|nr:hypothetical protein [Ensifer adhaerens]